MIDKYSLWIKSLWEEGHRDLHLETGADGQPVIVCVSAGPLFKGRRVFYWPETDTFEPVPEPKVGRKQGGSF